ncbi:Lipase 5 [Collariella sp. IMI 366227]|nr:Lipase 5 [Collariella sp. IMI 366227]
MSDLLVHGPGVPRLASQNAVSKAKRKLSTDHGSFQLSRLVKGATGVVSAWQDNFFKGGERARIEDRKQILAARMETATTFEDWQNAARELDHLEGNDAWKLDDQHRDCEFDPDLIRAKMEELDTARTDCDMSAMMYLIRSCLSRELGGMGDADLYRHSYMGTKVLIERYVQSAVQTIEAVVEKSSYQTEMGARELLDGMVYARQTYGRSALLLSGGATFGMSHIGVVKSLFEQGMLPRVVSGASAGSIVCAVLCTRKDEEIPDLIRAFPFGDLAVFETPGETEWDHLRRLITKHSWSDISNLTRVMRGWLGDMTFLEAYNRSRRVCNICVSSASIYDVPRLLNYVTAPDVLIWTAVAASCSVPLVFQAHPLLMKNPATGAHEPWIAAPQHYIDGSVDNDLPMPRLAEMFNVNHFIVSQVNPHIVPFLPRDDVLVPGKPRPKSPPQPPSAARQWLTKLAATTFTEGLHRLHFLAESGVFPNLMTKLYCVLSQTYSGDITIIPEIPASDLPVMLKNPTAEFMQRNCLVGERAVWPKMGRIRDRLSVELALDRAVHALRTKVVFRSSQVDMRRAMGRGSRRVEDDEEEEEEEEDRLEIGRGQGLREEWTPVVAKGTPKAAAAAVSGNTTTGRRRARSFKAGSTPLPHLRLLPLPPQD